MNELMKEVENYCEDRNNGYILERALIAEVFYQYQYLKDNEYEEVKDVNLTLENIINIARDILSTYYMNEGFNELITNWLFDSIKRNGEGELNEYESI
jgi:hypothetical protein